MCCVKWCDKFIKEVIWESEFIIDCTWSLPIVRLVQVLQEDDAWTYMLPALC